MEEYIIIDNMKKESKRCKNAMLICFVCSIILPIAYFFNKKSGFSDTEVVLTFAYFFLLGCIGLYGYLYSVKYKVMVSKDKIYLKSLFKNEEIFINSIRKYECKKLKLNKMYKFKLFLPKKNITIYLRSKNVMAELLEIVINK